MNWKQGKSDTRSVYGPTDAVICRRGFTDIFVIYFVSIDRVSNKASSRTVIIQKIPVFQYDVVLCGT